MAGVPLRSSTVVAVVMAVMTVFAQTSTQQTSTQQTPISVPTPTPQAAPEVTTGLILGRAVDGDTGKAIAGALVTLSMIAPAQIPGAPGPPPNANRQPARVISDGEGRFVFSGLPKGMFTILATKPGYPATTLGRRFASDTGSQTLVLGEAERRGDLTMRFWKYASLTGTVIDEAGEPVIGLQVRVLRRTIAGGRVVFTPFGNAPATDDRGSYRIASLVPGDYAVGIVMTQTTVPSSLQDAYAAARKGSTSDDFNREMDRSGGGVFEPGIGAGSSGQRFGSWLLADADRSAVRPAASDGGRIFVYPTVYFSNASMPSKATIVTVGSGEERAGIDFHLKPVITSRVFGTLIGLNGPESQTVLRLFAGGTSDLLRESDFVAATTTTDATGSFVFLGVTPGAYTIRALKVPPRPVLTGGFTSVVQVGNSTIYSGGGGPSTPAPIPPEPTMWASQAVSVGDTDITGVVVGMRTGARLSGTLKFDGAAEPPPPDRLVQITVQVDTADARLNSSNQSNISRGVVDTTGQFRTYQFPPGRYVVRASSVQGWTFKNATLAGRDITDAPLDLGAEDVSNIVVTFTDRPSDLSGSARDSKGPDSTATVLLFPTTQALWSDHGSSPRRFRTSRVGSDGSYRITNVPPGDYWVVAVRSATPSEWLDPKFLQKLTALATRVTIEDGEKKSIDVDTREIR